MERVIHRTISTNGINMHVAELGSGPVVLFLHGFPECWYSWRKQMVAFSEAGYRAIAPDLRGYGETDSPAGVEKYTYLHIVGDVIGLLDALKIAKVYLVSHDWGAIIGWQVCLLRPDRVIAHAALSVYYKPRHPVCSLVERLRTVFGENHYIVEFQKPGKVEEIITRLSPEKFFKRVFSGRFTQDIRTWFTEQECVLPSWISDDDIAYYVNAFKKNGFSPAINYYRALDLSWELTAPWTGSKVIVPSIFIIGDKDITYTFPGAKKSIHGDLTVQMSNLKNVIVLENTGHFMHEQNPEVINCHILSFFKTFSGRASL